MNSIPNQKYTSSGSHKALPSFRHRDNPSTSLGTHNDRRRPLSDLHRSDYSHYQHYQHNHPHHRHHVREKKFAVQTQLPGFVSDRKLHTSVGTRSAAGERERAVDIGGNVSVQQTKVVSKSVGAKGAIGQAQKSKVNENRLRVSLDTLSDHANTATSQLDHSYYSLLEHVGYLESGVEQLVTLSRDIREASSEHGLQLDQLCTDLHGQVNTFGNFESQGQRIYDLESRLRREKETAEDLKDRLDAVRQRLRSREKEDAENWKQTRLRLRILWGTIVSVILLFCAIAIFQNFWSGSSTRLSRSQSTLQTSTYNAHLNGVERMTSITTATAVKTDDGHKKTRSNRWHNIFDEL